MFRGIAANAVVLSHLAIIETKYSHGFVLLPQWLNFAGSSGVHFFFVISGFVMALIGPGTGWLQFFIARVVRIYPIYWIYTSAVLIVFLFAPAMVNSAYEQPPSILKSYLLWPQEMGPLLAVGWTLIHEMYFYLVMSAFIAFAVPLRYGLAIWALVVATGYLSGGPGFGPLLSIVFSPMTLEFIAGACVGLLIRRNRQSFAITSLIVGLCLFVIGAVVHVVNDVVLLGPASILLLGVPFPFIVYGGAALERRGRWPRLKLLEQLGDASYSTYLSHVLVLSAVGRVFQLFPVHNWVIEVGFVIAALLLANLVGVLSFRYLERPLLALRRLIPRRDGPGAVISA